MSTSKKVIEAEEILNAYFAVSNVIGSKEEENVINLLRKIPEGMDTKIIEKALVKLGPLKVFKYSSKFNPDYLPVLKDALKTFLDDTFQSKMMLHCLYAALENDFTLPEAYKGYGETAAFLQYLDKFEFPVEKPEQYSKSDEYITAAVVKNVEQVLTSVEFTLRDLRIFRSLVYILAKSDSPRSADAVVFQDANTAKLDRTSKLSSMHHAFGTNQHQGNTGKAYHLVDDKLRAIQAEGIGYQIISKAGLELAVDLSWKIEIRVGAGPGQNKPGRGSFVAVSISNASKDSFQIEVNGPKGKEKGNQKSGIIEGKGLGFKKIDVFNLRSEMEEVGRLYGIEKLYWEEVLIESKAFSKSDLKKIKKIVE